MMSIMKAHTILISSFFGIVLGASIGIAQASEVPVTRSPAALEAPTHPKAQEDVIFLQEVTITATPKAHPAVTRRPPTAKAWTCSVEQLAQGSGTVRYCRPQ
jgi:hypothetical protein